MLAGALHGYAVRRTGVSLGTTFEVTAFMRVRSLGKPDTVDSGESIR